MLNDNMSEKMSAEDKENLKRRLEEKYGDKKKKKNKKKKDNQDKNEVLKEETEKEIIPKPVKKIQKKEDFSVENVTAQNLRNAIIWSEVLGEPACKKRRSRRRF